MCLNSPFQEASAPAEESLRDSKIKETMRQGHRRRIVTMSQTRQGGFSVLIVIGMTSAASTRAFCLGHGHLAWMTCGQTRRQTSTNMNKDKQDETRTTLDFDQLPPANVPERSPWSMFWQYSQQSVLSGVALAWAPIRLPTQFSRTRHQEVKNAVEFRWYKSFQGRWMGLTSCPHDKHFPRLMQFVSVLWLLLSHFWQSLSWFPALCLHMRHSSSWVGSASLQTRPPSQSIQTHNTIKGWTIAKQEGARTTHSTKTRVSCCASIAQPLCKS